MSEISELEALADAAGDTQVCAAAIIRLRNELAAVGCQVSVDWSLAARAQRDVELAYFQIYDLIQEQARASL